MANVDQELMHYGVLGMKWGVRRYQNADGTLTEAGKRRLPSAGSQLRTAKKEAMAKATAAKRRSLRTPTSSVSSSLARYSPEAIRRRNANVVAAGNEAIRKKAGELLNNPAYAKKTNYLLRQIKSTKITDIMNEKSFGKAYVESLLVGEAGRYIIAAAELKRREREG